MGHIKAIIFDFFGVISIRGHQAFLEEKISEPAKLQHIYDLRRQHDIGAISVDDFLAEVGKATGTTPQEALEKLHSERVINKQLVDYIRRTLKPHYKIGMLSNAAGDLHTFVDQKLLDELFDDVLISAEVGMIKPDPRIFQLACEHLGVEPQEALMVDDLEENCQGAKNVGLEAIQYATFPHLRQDLERLK